MIAIENVDRVTKQLVSYGIKIRNEVSNQIFLLGDKVVKELQTSFPDLSITGQFFQDKIEYWITISRLGKPLTHIKCPVSNLFFTKKRDEFGKQEFKSTVPELNIDEIVKNITNELSLQIKVIGRNV